MLFFFSLQILCFPSQWQWRVYLGFSRVTPAKMESIYNAYLIPIRERLLYL